MKKLNGKKICCYLLILGVALIMSLPLWQEGIHTGHDGDFHISRTIGTLEQLEQGNSPFVVSRFSNGFGFAWNLFYPPVSTFLNVIFAFLTNNVVIAMKLFIFTTFLFSGISMFQFVHTISKNKFAALFASIFYMVAPYRLLNAYTRLAVGEMVSFIFIPIIFKGVYHLLQGNTKKSYWYVLGAIGLILSHNISTMLIFLLGFFYVLLHIKKLKDKKILTTFCVSTAVIILSVLFFEVPLLEQKSAVDLEVFRYGKMYSNLSVMGHALNPLQLFVRNAPGADSSMYFCIGLPLVLGVLFTPFIRKIKKKPYQKNYRFFLTVGCIATIMATFIFPWFLMPDVLLMIQFPWRMLVLVVFCFSIISGINWAIFLTMLSKKFAQKIKAKKEKVNTKNLISIFYYTCLTLLITLSCVYSMTYVQNLEMKNVGNSHYEEPEIIDTVNQVSRYSSFLEYWPQKAINSIDYVVNRDQKITIISGNAKIENERKANGSLSFSVSEVPEDTILELPYLFYKGYEVIYTPQNNPDSILLETTESEHGLVEIKVDSSFRGTITAQYHATTLHQVCMVISFTTFFAYLLYLLICFFKNRKTHGQQIVTSIDEVENHEVEDLEKKETISLS